MTMVRQRHRQTYRKMDGQTRYLYDGKTGKEPKETSKFIMLFKFS